MRANMEVNGYLPIDQVVIREFKKDRYVVLEGNRRLTALKALENPEFLDGVVPKGVLTEVRHLSKKYHDAPLDSIQCLVVKGQDEARHWIELRHTGENEGAGIVRWGSDDAARYR